MTNLESLNRAIEMGKRDDSLECTRAAIEASTPPDTILQAMVAAMDEVGRKFQCGEAFIPEMLEKIRLVRAMLGDRDLEIDGGINQTTAAEVCDAGANVLVAGNYVFSSDSYLEAIESLRHAAEHSTGPR